MPTPQAASVNDQSFFHFRSFAFTVVLASILLPLFYHFVPLSLSTSNSTIATTSNIMGDANGTQPSTRMPVYFLGIGGPNFIANVDHPAFNKLGETGREITNLVKPKAIVVFSAHWQHGPSKVAINVAETGSLIYDFYGFPSPFYDIKFPHKGSREVAENVIGKLSSAGISVDRVERGLDHGVWVGFLAAFDPEKNPIDVPIVQVSLFGDEDPVKHYRMGQALEQLRDEGVLIIGAGMAVHNLQDFRKTRGDTSKTMPYASTFESALTEAIATKEADRQMSMTNLLKRSDARQAHPSLEHVLPIHIVAGAAGSDVGERIWALPEGSLNWGQYRFGKLPAA